MTKSIIPIALVARLNPDGSTKSAILQYKINDDGKISRDIHTMSVKTGVKLDIFNDVLTDAKTHVEKGEKIK